MTLFLLHFLNPLLEESLFLCFPFTPLFIDFLGVLCLKYLLSDFPTLPVIDYFLLTNSLPLEWEEKDAKTEVVPGVICQNNLFFHTQDEESEVWLDG